MARGPAARRVGLATAVVVHGLVPMAVLIVLVGFAFGWWIAAFLGLGIVAMAALSCTASRSRGALGRAFGTVGWDPLAYDQWTRYLVVRPLVVSLPVSIALILAIVLTASVAVVAAAALIGLGVGVGLWNRIENRRGRHP